MKKDERCPECGGELEWSKRKLGAWYECQRCYKTFSKKEIVERGII